MGGAGGGPRGGGPVIGGPCKGGGPCCPTVPAGGGICGGAITWV